MGYLIDGLFPRLKHSAPNESIDSDTLKEVIWYSPTSQAYIQRENKYDLSELSSSTTDIFVSLYLCSVFNTPQIRVFSRVADCSISVDSRPAEDISEPCLYVAKSKSKSLFFDIIDKMRNAIAHGSINRVDNMTYLVNQYKPKIDAEVNFLLQSDTDINDAVYMMQKDFSSFLSDSVGFKYNCLKSCLGLKKDDISYISTKTNRRIIIDNDFKYKSNRRVDEIKLLINHYKSIGPVDVIISENIGNISDRNLHSLDEIVRIVPQGRLKDYYSIDEVQYV